MVHLSTVTRLDGGKRRPETEIRRLVTEAADALAAVVAGDVDSVFAAHRAINRAVGIVLDNRISTSSCRICGAQVSAGRCWGCGAPPERAS